MLKAFVFSIFLAGLTFPSIARADNALSVGSSPVFSLVTVNPGQLASRRLTLTNSSDLALDVTMESRSFVTTDDQGGSDYPNLKSGAQHWFSFSPSTFSIPAHATKQVIVNIQVPKDAISGGHYASVFFIANAPQNPYNSGTEVNFSARVGSFFFMTVGGDLHPDGKLIRFDTNTFWQRAPAHFNVSMHNFGNVHIKPHSVLQVSNVFGKKVSESVDPGLYVLPGKTRNWELLSSTKLSPGFYRAKLITKITPQSRESIAVRTFWILPWQLVTIIFLTLLVGAVILRPQLVQLYRDFKAAGGIKKSFKKLLSTLAIILKKILSKINKMSPSKFRR